MNLYEIDARMHTDPILIKDILKNDMYLYNLNEVKELFSEEMKEEKSLEPMIGRIRFAVLNKHKAIYDFLCEAQNKKLFTPLDNIQDEALTRMINHMYVLDVLTNKMANDFEFMAVVRDQILKVRQGLGVPADLIGQLEFLKKVTGSMFIPVKTVTMDWVFSEYVDIRSKGELKGKQKEARAGGLKLNILEASVTEKNNGFLKNAVAGIALGEVAPKDIYLEGKKTFLYTPTIKNGHNFIKVGT